VGVQEPVHRRPVRVAVAGDHPGAQIVTAGRGDPTPRADALAAAIDNQREHHPRVVRRPAPPVSTVGPREPRQVQLSDQFEHIPHPVPGRQQVTDINRKQRELIALVTTNPGTGHTASYTKHPI
jgi:hypothetical protein